MDSLDQTKISIQQAFDVIDTQKTMLTKHIDSLYKAIEDQKNIRSDQRITETLLGSVSSAKQMRSLCGILKYMMLKKLAPYNIKTCKDVDIQHHVTINQTMAEIKAKMEKETSDVTPQPK